MNEYKKIELVAKGKTKEVWKTNIADMVIWNYLSKITVNDDSGKPKEFKSKAKYITSTKARVFELLEKAGIPTSYIGQFSETEIVAKNCKMIPLEVAVHRFALGNYLKYHPEFKEPENNLPHRFHSLCLDLFLKTTNGSLLIDEKKIISELSIEDDDTIIVNPESLEWTLLYPNSFDTASPENTDRKTILPEHVEMKLIDELSRKAFLVLEGAWNSIGYRLIDCRLEFGITEDCKLVIAEVIDNDSWGLCTDDWQEMSNYVFCERYPIAEVEDKYERVAQLVSQFRIPEQTIVLWRGSESDKLPDIPNLAGLNIETPVISGHKKTVLVTKELERLHTLYPEGGVIIALVGMSNGLGPILSARTNWQVISVCTTAKEFPEDVWSTLRMPSNVPNATMLDDKNAVLCALNILGQKNPAIYAYRRLAIEKLDI